MLTFYAKKSVFHLSIHIGDSVCSLLVLCFLNSFPLSQICVSLVFCTKTPSVLYTFLTRQNFIFNPVAHIVEVVGSSPMHANIYYVH